MTEIHKENMRCLKSALILIIAAFALESRANLINYEYSGTITSAFSQKMGASDFGINAGDPFRFNITIDSDAQEHYATLYYMPALLTLTIGDKQFGSSAGTVRVWQRTPSGDSTFGNAEPASILYSGWLSVPWGQVGGSLFSDVSIGSHSLSLGSVGYSQIIYHIDGTVTSVVRTPESSSTALLLSLALVPLLALCPVKRRTRQV